MNEEKLVLFKIIGDFDRGFTVSAELGLVGSRPDLESRGFLPSNSILYSSINEWRINYRNQPNTARLKPSGIRYNISVDELLERSSSFTQDLGKKPTSAEKTANSWLGSSESFVNVDILGLDHPWSGGSTHLKSTGIEYDISLDEILGYASSSTQTLEKKSRSVENLFKSWLNSSESFLAIEKKIETYLNTDDKVQIIIQADNKGVLYLPWHLWHCFDTYKYANLAFSPLTFHRKNVYFGQKPSTEERKVKVLAVLGSQNGIDIQFDHREILNLKLKARISVEIEELHQPRKQEIISLLENGPTGKNGSWDIFFFAGHGETQGDVGRIYISEENSISLDEIKVGLNKAVENGLRIAIFNSCDGLGLARDLESIQVPYFVVMKELVPDKVAHHFLKYFLEIFSGEQSVGREEYGEEFFRNLDLCLAMRYVQKRLQRLDDNDYPCASWLPVVFQNPTEKPLTWMQLQNEVKINRQGTKKFYPSNSVPGNTQENKAKVIERITSNHPGRVYYDGTYWQAFLAKNNESWMSVSNNIDNTRIEVGESAMIVSMASNSLIVRPDKANSNIDSGLTRSSQKMLNHNVHALRIVVLVGLFLGLTVTLPFWWKGLEQLGFSNRTPEVRQESEDGS